MTKQEFLDDVFSQKIKKRERFEPKVLGVYAPAKQGKSAIMAGLTRQLNGKAKILCNEMNGYKNQQANVTYCTTYKSFIAALLRFRDEAHDFSHLVLDGGTIMQNWAMLQGTLNYMNSNAGKNFNRTKEGVRLKPEDKNFKDVTSLGENGWGWQRQVMVNYLLDNIIMKMPEHLNIIIVFHTKDKVVEAGISGTKITNTHIDLVGKNSEIYSGRLCALARLSRSKTEAYLHFNSLSSETSSGTRYGYLAKEPKILISKYLGEDENGQDIIETYWENVYPSIKNNKQ